ncbi:MAG: hypothetical protein Kilf2KO_11650 [Rhodospirillales bacterium]
MPSFNFFQFLFGSNVHGTDQSDLIVGTFDKDHLNGKGGDDLILGLFGGDKISGGDGEDHLFGGFGKDVIVGNVGNDQMFGDQGDDRLIWNNGDGSDLMDGGKGHDQVQVNFDTDLVNDDLQNKDVAEISVTDKGVQFARIEVNDQTERGLFQLDIRNTETLETNFGDGDDTAVIKDEVLEEILLDLDGGDGEDLLDLSQASDGVAVDLQAGELDDSTAENFENVIGTEFDDELKGDEQDNDISGLGGADNILGRAGDDILVGGKGGDVVNGGRGDDALVWNNGDGSDRLNGGKDEDLVQVNFDTDLVNDDLQNKDVAEISVTDKGVQFARTEVNDQSDFGLFQLDILNTETLETNFGDGDDTAVIKDDLLDKILLDLDGGDGLDLLDLGQAAAAVEVDLDAGTIGTTAGASSSTAVNFEQVTGTAFDDTIRGNDQDNVIRGGVGNDILSGGKGADAFVFFEEDAGVDIILDFEVGVDRLQFFTTDPAVTTDNLLGNMAQVGNHVELALNNKVITFEDTAMADFGADDFMIM